MKSPLSPALLTWLALPCAAFAAAPAMDKATPKLAITAANPLTFSRASQTIELSAKDLAPLGEKDLAKVHILDATGREVLAQGRLKDLGPLLVIWGACMLVLVETNDLGSALLYFGIFLAMVYIATGRLTYVLGGVGLFAIGGFGAYEKIPHVHERVIIWLQPWTTKPVYCPLNGLPALRQDCQSYQLVKSLYSKIGRAHV